MATPWLSQTADGFWLAPAFVDRHSHPLFAARESGSLNLEGCNSIDQIVETLRGYLKQNPNTKWLDASPFDRNLSGDFTREVLDNASSSIAISLHSSDHHALWVNSAALSGAGIGEAAVSLADGEVVCDSTGRPSGLLLEWSAMKLVLDKMPAPSLEQDLDYLKLAHEIMQSNGIVAVTDAWIDPGMGEVYVEAAKRSALLVPTELYVRVDPTAQDAQLSYLETLLSSLAGLGEETQLRVAGVKLFADGVLGSNTAQVSGGYFDGSEAKPIWTSHELQVLLRRLAALDPNLRPHFHAIGDLAVKQSLDAIAFARAENLWKGDAKPVVAHAELVSSTDAARMAQLGVEVAISPQWLGVEAIDGCGRAHTSAGDFEPLLRAEACLTYGSDWPVSAPRPLDAIARATKHLVAKGFTVEAALEAAWRIASGPNWHSLDTDASNTAMSVLRLSANPLEVAAIDVAALTSIRVL